MERGALEAFTLSNISAVPNWMKSHRLVIKACTHFESHEPIQSFGGVYCGCWKEGGGGETWQRTGLGEDGILIRASAGTFIDLSRAIQLLNSAATLTKQYRSCVPMKHEKHRTASNLSIKRIEKDPSSLRIDQCKGGLNFPFCVM